MKKGIIIIISLMMAISLSAQEQKKFSPEKFDADMEEYIIRKANLDQQEAAKLFPIFKEMHKKQRNQGARQVQSGAEAIGADLSSEDVTGHLCFQTV